MVVATVPLGGEPEYPQADPATGIIYQNLEDTSELVVVDPQKQAATQRYKLGPCEGPTGLASMPRTTAFFPPAAASI